MISIAVYYREELIKTFRSESVPRKGDQLIVDYESKVFGDVSNEIFTVGNVRWLVAEVENEEYGIFESKASVVLRVFIY